MTRLDITTNFMASRYEHLSNIFEGYKLTGVPFIEYDGTQLLPCRTLDDMGIYNVIPTLAYHLGISIDQAIVLFFTTLSWLAVIISITGFWFLYKNYLERCIASCTVTLLTLMVCSYTLDVYRAYVAIAIAVVPWCLYFIQKKYTSTFFYVFCFLAGLGIGFSHYIRSHSGTAVFLFITILILTHKRLNKKKKCTLMMSLCLGILIPVIYFKHIYSNYVHYSKQHFPEYLIDEGQHVFWHPVYLGFGFLNNDFGIRFDDSVAVKKARSIKPDIAYPSPESEEILKQEVVTLFKHRIFFFLLTIWAKIGVLLFFLLLFANIGLPLAFIYPKGLAIDAAFFLALSFSGLFIILVVPAFGYCLGFITFSTLYGIVSINYALEHCGLTKISSSFKRRSKHGTTRV